MINLIKNYINYLIPNNNNENNNYRIILIYSEKEQNLKLNNDIYLYTINIY